MATRTGGTPEIIQDGENGLLFTPHDPEDLAMKIARLGDDPESRRRIASAGRQTILERFTITRMMDEFEAYLQEVASASAADETHQVESLVNPG
jgi:glycosyltransferase involved in cell wall biosynthesis